MAYDCGSADGKGGRMRRYRVKQIGDRFYPQRKGLLWGWNDFPDYSRFSLHAFVPLSFDGLAAAIACIADAMSDDETRKIRAFYYPPDYKRTDR